MQHHSKNAEDQDDNVL